MIDAPLNNLWSLPITRYTELYINDAVSMRLAVPSPEMESIGNVIASLGAMHTIPMLANSSLDTNTRESIIAAVTLQDLKNTLELVRLPDGYRAFADRQLVAGCIVLMSSVKPSPFGYEYGYLCFRLVVIALNACFLHYASCLDVIISDMGNGPAEDYLKKFWVASETAIMLEFTDTDDDGHLTVIRDSPPPARWTTPLTDYLDFRALLDILHDDQKNFLITLRTANSLRLSGLMYILWRYVESEKSSDRP
ncbi:hypothetical protein RSOLAG22IIIB_08682 [Rhizoctonia solani]|uniref:Uncharacterized protein n=1 Tax=Rhizoctonia solani TaxID=456999 RepID=A0A0K6FU28_9AGAM|nr:hypothetical protein RSOLAG22IIIB_08682 [Rhizoctonia solani]